ncbi:hypothetical protein pipiens_004597 [Culex pipiens pipiens]|uniref:Uncharacterized protein n=1 Tax=Culex pipiens pipiens TaxID=38569 RepID=A0ABD1CH67_CULPP
MHTLVNNNACNGKDYHSGLRNDINRQLGTAGEPVKYEEIQVEGIYAVPYENCFYRVVVLEKVLTDFCNLYSEGKALPTSLDGNCSEGVKNVTALSLSNHSSSCNHPVGKTAKSKP